jgi:hypothetical protein
MQGTQIQFPGFQSAYIFHKGGTGTDPTHTGHFTGAGPPVTYRANPAPTLEFVFCRRTYFL